MKVNTKLLLPNVILLFLAVVSISYAFLDMRMAENLLRKTISQVEYANKTLNYINALQKAKDINLLSYKFIQKKQTLSVIKKSNAEMYVVLSQLKEHLKDEAALKLLSQFIKIKKSSQSIQDKLILSIQQADIKKTESTFIQWEVLSLQAEAVLKDLTNFNVKRINDVVDEFNKLQKDFAITTGSMLVFLVFIIILSSFYYHYFIVKPICALSSKMNQFSIKKTDNNIDYIDFIDSNDEVSNLAKSFNKMAKDLLHTTVSRDSLANEIERRKALEKDLEKAEERTRLVVESESNALILANESGFITMVNRQTEVIFGYDRKELLGQPIEVLLPKNLREVHKKHFRRFKQDMNKRSMGKGKELFGLHKKGNTIPVEVVLSPIEFASGVNFLASVTDISERLAAQQEKDNLIKRLSQSNEELERFAFICSHDLQEPLRMVRSYSEKLQVKLDKTTLDEKASRYMLYMTEGATRAQELITDILAYSRLDVEARLELVNIEDTLASVSDCLQSVIDKTGAKIQYGLLPSLYANQTLMLQLFQNLISNALKYCDKAPVVEIAFNWKGDWGVFSIKDNGIGIAPDYHTKIFKIFQRLHGKNEYSGTGIGLAICKKIVEQHGGKISVLSEKGHGATFECSFPSDIIVIPQKEVG
ncbi:ATP-binding protein [Spartinivicinus poritis]|uniref:histidine kinase n=1 Tax=Spartinivicinus poritis TaxID=2994640 RepID=A0ABT5U6B3_9GAMM|nr:ATP-binding protein [Spartinivicinus sp. A2-2]MDE1461906.1 ATP-binding protein [Spartinivicinus sp. A2-2]